MSERSNEAFREIIRVEAPNKGCGMQIYRIVRV